MDSSGYASDQELCVLSPFVVALRSGFGLGGSSEVVRGILTARVFSTATQVTTYLVKE